MAITRCKLFDYTVPGDLPGNSVTVWSRLPLQPCAADVLTPLSFSVLTELVGRAWHRYYDRLGFDPAPRSRLVRQVQGRAYQNLSISARIEAEQAGIEPLTLSVNGVLFSLCDLQKPGFLGGIKLGRAQRKIEDLLTTLAQEIAAITDRAQSWYVKTQGLRWSQAEVLQVMEEIERVGIDSMMAFFAARHNLALCYARLVQAMAGQTPFPANLLLINNTLCDLGELVESDMAAALVALADAVSEQGADDKAALDWLKASSSSDWRSTVSNDVMLGALDAFLTKYGHRAINEGEMANARWNEDAWPVLRGLHACVVHEAKLPAKMPPGHYTQQLLDVIEPQQRKASQQILEKIRRLHHLQSRALHALAYVWAGTRRWALAAAGEAMADNRLLAPGDIFFFELEEIKQMMTGEWNVSDVGGIQATCEQRKSEHSHWQQESPPDILFGDVAGRSSRSGLPGVSGHASAPLCRWGAHMTNGCEPAIIGALQFDSGWSLTLPVADGFVAAGGASLDAFVAAARAWHHPVVVGLGDRYQTLVEGAQTTVDGDAITVEQVNN